MDITNEKSKRKDNKGKLDIMCECARCKAKLKSALACEKYTGMSKTKWDPMEERNKDTLITVTRIQ